MKQTKQSQTPRQFAENAYALFRQYRSAYVKEWQRLSYCEPMYRGDHCYDLAQEDPIIAHPFSPIL